MKSISSEGGVGGRVLLLREGCETDYYYKLDFRLSFFNVKIFCAGSRRFFIFLSCESETATLILDFNLY